MTMVASRANHLGLALIAGSVLILEVALTRVFAVMLYNHYTFLVIAMALLGFGAAGSFVSARQPDLSGPAARRLVRRAATGFAIATLVCAAGVTRLGLEQFDLSLSANTLKLVLAYSALAVPFFFAGLAICVVLSASSAQINTLYFADLVGAGAGALVVTLLLDAIGAPATILLACTLALVSALHFSEAAPRSAPVGGAVVFAGLTCVVFALDPWTVPVASSKGLHGNEPDIEHTRWTAHGRIDVLTPRPLPVATGTGVSAANFHRKVECRRFFMDGSNPSHLYRHDQDRWFLDAVLTAAPYSIAPEAPRVLVIGSGGAIDVQVALEHEATRVTAVEINPHTVELARARYANYVGDVFARPGVEAVAAEGRHFLTLTTDRYDVIRLTGVDTRSSAAFGANALDHYYLYTVEAIQDFYAHLDDDGVLSMSRRVGWQGMRLVGLMVEALEALGEPAIGERLAIVGNGRSWDVMLGRSPFTPAQTAALRAWAVRAKLDVIYDPHAPGDRAVARLVSATPAERERLYAASTANLRPVTDDSPFFFESLTLGRVLAQILDRTPTQTVFSGHFVLLVALAQATLLSALFILLPLHRRRKTMTKIRGTPFALGYFALVGLGFILVELVFIQKFTIVLGGPAYSMSVTLFSILVFSGLGAFTAGRVAIGSRGASVGVPALVCALLIGTLFLVGPVVDRLLSFGFAARVVLASLSLAPISFALGLPFPTGIRILDRRAPGLVPWAWAANACLTVIGSVLCVIVSIAWGFSTALVLAAVSYAAAALCLSRIAGDRLAGPA